MASNKFGTEGLWKFQVRIIIKFYLFTKVGPIRKLPWLG